MYEIGFDEFQEIISKTRFANHGDSYERDYGALIIDRFPNCEVFWSHFVVPLTKRIEPQVKDPDEKIRFRKGISEDLIDIASFHYSMFVNLIYSHDHLRDRRLAFFEDFYVHSVAACDLAEEFLLRVYLLILECTNQQSQTLQLLTREEFLDIAGKWYDKNYSKVYQNYLKKGKSGPPIRLPSRKNVLDEYFLNSPDWRNYKRDTQSVREYRNVIAHHVQIGQIIGSRGTLWVPRKEKIQRYKRWPAVFAAMQDPDKKNDLIRMDQQMIWDIGQLEYDLNRLWHKVVNDLRKLLFDDRNQALLRKYNISFP